MFFSLSLAGNAVHELRAPASSYGHAVLAILRLAEMDKTSPILWAGMADSIYPPGLAWLGLDPGRCLFAQTRDDAECLGTLEVALRGGMAGVAECHALSRLAARRLALAAKTGGSIGFLLRHAPQFTASDSSAMATRWLITPQPGEGPARYKAELLYAKTRQTGVFEIELKEKKYAAAPPALIMVGGRDAPDLRRAG